MFGPPTKEELLAFGDKELVEKFKWACIKGNEETINALQEELVSRFWRLRFRLETSPIRV